jgi:hypothetical protein
MPTTLPWTATVTAKLTRTTGIDTQEEVGYSQGRFTRRQIVTGSPFLSPIIVLDRAAREELKKELASELESVPAGIDVHDLKGFSDLLVDSLESGNSDLFKDARFGEVVRDIFGGEITSLGQVSFGTDLVGTVRDDARDLTFERHPVGMTTGPFRSLTPADQASLATALTTYLEQPGANQGWAAIRDDALRGAGQ